MLFHFVNAEVQLRGAENINTGTDIAAEGQASFVQCLPTCYFSPLNASGYFREESGYWVELQGKKIRPHEWNQPVFLVAGARFALSPQSASRFD